MSSYRSVSSAEIKLLSKKPKLCSQMSATSQHRAAPFALVSAHLKTDLQVTDPVTYSPLINVT